jgi:microcystin-dependent protein
MSNNLNKILTLAQNYPLQSTLQVSNTSYSVLLFLQPLLSSRYMWLDRQDELDEITDEQWDELESYVDKAYRELMTPMIGQVMAYVTALPPPNVLACDGSQYLRSEFPDLYALLDTTFIVDADHFRVPDLRGRTVIGAGAGIGLTSRSPGASLGEENHALTDGENANHTHVDSGHSHVDLGHTHVDNSAIPTAILIGAGVPAPSAIPSVAVTGAGFANIANGFAAIQSSGLGTPHNNMQPSYALNYGLVAR